MDVTRIFKACSEILKGNDNVAVLPAYNGIPEKTIVVIKFYCCFKNCEKQLLHDLIVVNRRRSSMAAIS